VGQANREEFFKGGVEGVEREQARRKGRGRYLERNDIILSIPEQFLARDFIVGDLYLETPVRFGGHGIGSHCQNAFGVARISSVTSAKEG
jgi:hypothetical protein